MLSLPRLLFDFHPHKVFNSGYKSQSGEMPGFTFIMVGFEQIFLREFAEQLSKAWIITDKEN